MKFLRVLLIILLIVVVVVVILGMVGPKSYDVSQTRTIEAPKELVFAYLKSLKKGNEWGPWRDQDPDMEVSYEGDDGTVGFVSKWDGPLVGKGEQTITAIEDDSSIETDITFYSPFGKMYSEGYMRVADAEQGTDVTWGFKGENNFIARVFSVFSNMEKNTAPMFAKGLENLDSLVRADMNKEYNGLKVQYKDVPERTFMARRAVVKWADMQAFYATHLPRIGAAAARAGVQMNGMPCGLYYSWDEENEETDMAAAMPVARAFEGKDMEVIRLPAAKAAVVDYYGDYDNLGAAHEAIDAYLQNFGLTSAPPVVEEYVTDPGTEPDPAKWLTRIVYRIE
ncbi:MAG: SRPBCC family protein [Saprospiraceae bacterium]|nr:SRPBCC family protein [Saprospiraceae bacterium]